MRYYLVVYLLLSSIALQAQYIDSIGSVYIDSLHITLRDEFLATNYKQSIKLSEEFLQYWDQKKKESPNEKAVWNNYFYSVIENFKSQRRLGMVDKPAAQAFMNVESDIIQQLGRNNIILANFYSIAGETYHTTLFDRVASVEAARKSIAIRMQNHPVNFKAVMNDYMIMGYGFKRRSEFDSSLYYLDKAHQSGKKMIWIDTSMLMINQYAIGTTYQEMKNYKKALEVFKDAFYLGEGAVPVGHTANVYLVNAVANNSEVVGDLETAIEFSFKALSLAKLKPENYTENMHTLYETIARLYLIQGEIFQSNAYLDSAFVCLDKNKLDNGRASLMSLKADLATDIEEKIRLYELANEFCKTEPDCKSEEYHKVLTDIAEAYEQKGDYQSALNLGLQAKALQENDVEFCDRCKPRTYSVVARSLASMGRYEDAIIHAKLSIDTEKSISSDTSYLMAKYSNELARYQSLNGDVESAEFVYKENLDRLESAIGANANPVIQAQNNLAELYYQQGKYQEALEYVERSIDALPANSSQSNNLSVAPNLLKAKCHAKLMEHEACVTMLDQLLIDQGFNNLNAGTISEYDIADHELWYAYQALVDVIYIEDYIERSSTIQIGKIKTALTLINELRSLYFFEASEVIFQKEIRKFIDWTLAKLNKSYGIDNDTQLLPLIYECMEQSKSIMINRNFVRTQSIRNTNLPQDIVEQEKSILMEYQFYYKKYEAQKYEANDSLNNLYISKMYELENEKDELIRSLKAQYPEYYENRYSQNISTLNEMQNLARKEDIGILIFYWGESELMNLVINPNSTRLFSVPLEDIEQDIAEFQQEVKVGVFAEPDFKTKLERFTSISNSLSKNLISPLAELNLPFDLVVIPDGGLVNFPFDLLLSDKVSDISSYRDLPYLIKKHAVSYTGAASQLMNKISYSENDNRYLGFAPSYMQEENNFLKDMGQVNRSENLEPLMYNKFEVESASQLLNGEVLVGKDATVDSFLERAHSCDYLHLAMHAVVDDEFPLESHLSFSVDDSTGVAGKLEVREISKLQLENELVVLSACETNVGENILGEGIFGIARAFNLASCPSLIMSSWVVDDKSSSVIMQSFFQNFVTSKNVSNSLRAAKLDFLENSSQLNAHPAYWATYNYYGNPINNTPVSFMNSNLTYFIGALGLLLFGGFLGFRSIKRQA